MDSSSSTALVRKRQETDLMPPPPPAKKIKRPKQVLDEDTYTEALSRIIARDFFPGLLQSETQQEYLDALESKDAGWIDSAGMRLRQVMTPGRRTTTDLGGATPRVRTGSETPGGRTPDTLAAMTPRGGVAGLSGLRDDQDRAVDTNMSLGAFQTKYTSEDNESFYKVLDKQNQKRADKYAWLWRGNKLPSKQQLKQLEVNAKHDGRIKGLLDNSYDNNKLLRNDQDDRSAAPDAWKSDARNTLMFNHEGLEHDAPSAVSGQGDAKAGAGPKSIIYANTRMPDPGITFRPPSPTLSAVREAIAGRPRRGDRDSTMSMTGTSGGETPRVNGYAFVDDEEPEPEAAPLPLIDLGPGDATPNPFKLHEQSKREDLHHRMVDKIAQGKRSSAKNGLVGKDTPASRYGQAPKAALGGLTPAAQRLWNKLGTPRHRSMVGDTPFERAKTPGGSRISGLKGPVATRAL